MRKILAFLLLFGGGLVLLWSLENRSPKGAEPVPLPREGGPELSEGLPSEPGMQLGGGGQIILYAGAEGRTQDRRTFLHIDYEDSRTEGNVDVLQKVSAELFDPASETTTKQADIVTNGARLVRLTGDDERDLGYENRVRLQGVKASFLQGVFLAPLTFESSEAVLNALQPVDRRIESPQRFTLSSPRLDAGGEGILMHLDADLLEVTRRGWLVFHAPQEDPGEAGPTTARFSSLEEGALQVRTQPGSEPRVFVAKAWDGTRLDISGERPAVLTARETTLRAGEEGETLTLDDLDAVGDVRVELDGNVFEGESAGLRFDAQGALLSASLEGLPRAVFPLEEAELPSALTQEAEEPATGLRVDLSGDDTLTVRWDEGYHVALTGPTTLAATGLSMRAAQGLTGFRSEDGRVARFEVKNGVVLETDRGTLETAELEIELDPADGGGLRFRAKASHGARIVGTLEDGRPFTATTPDTMTVVGTESGWLVQEGTMLEVSVGGSRGFFARADRVENVDLRDLALVAHGNVHYRHEAEGRNYRLDTDRLQLAGEEIEEASGLTVQRYVIEAHGHVRGTQGAADSSVTFEGEHMTAVHDERMVPGPVPGGPGVIESTSDLRVSGKVDADVSLRSDRLTLKADEVRVERRLRGEEILEETLTADGAVEFEGRRGFPFQGSGDRLVFRGDRTGRLVAHEGRITLQGKLENEELPFHMTADEVTFAREEGGGPGASTVHAVEPALRVADYRVRAKRLQARGDTIELFEDVRASGFTARDLPWSLETDHLLLQGRAAIDEAGRQLGEADLRSIYATEGVQFRLEGVLRAAGETFEWKKIHGTMRVEGDPVKAYSSVARTYMETDWIEFDPALQMITGTGPGQVIPVKEPPEDSSQSEAPRTEGVRRAAFAPQQEEQEFQVPEAGEGTTIRFLSTRSQVDVGNDSLVFLMQEPVFDSPKSGTLLRASWAVFWIDRQRWLEYQDAEGGAQGDIVESLRRSFDDLQGDAEARGPLSELIDRFRSGPLAGLLREVYFEGPVEFSENGDLLFRANAVYLDAVASRGWLAGATVNIYGRLVAEDFEKLIVKADWLRHSADGALRANDATVTSCTYDDPHLKVVTGDLRIYPLGASRGPGEAASAGVSGARPARNRPQFRLIMKDNRVELWDTLRIPLPTIDLKTDHKFRPLWRTLSLANSARFGTLFSLGASIPAGDVGEFLNEKVSEDKDKLFDASFEIEGSYLGSRGALLDVGLEAKSNQNYDFELYAGLIYDRDEDRGYVRVDEEDRSQFRYWLRSFGHFERGSSTLTYTFSHLSDAAVQSEFYEGEFLTYERDETYLQWHRSDDEWFSQISVKPRVDDFRSEIEELPSAGVLRSRAPLFHVGKQPVTWIGDARADYLRRREADVPGPDLGLTGDPSDYDPQTSPFGLPPRFPDLLGEREVLRVDTEHALEAPMALNAAGLRFTPFVRARGTYWSEGVDVDESPTRGLVEAGARLATTFWRDNSNGTFHQIVPYVGVRSELVREEEGVPVGFDEVEDVLTGDVVEAGARGRFGVLNGVSHLDFDVRGRYAADRSDGKADGWLPIGTFTRLNVSPFGRRFEVWYDARYDPKDSQTDYSLVSIGTRFGERFGLQAGHQRGRSTSGDSRFEAATVEAIFRWTEKWEFEAHQAFSLLDNQRLDLHVLVRRYGHDVVLDLETAVREGEGTSLGISLRPRFGYRRPRIGYVPW